MSPPSDGKHEEESSLAELDRSQLISRIAELQRQVRELSQAAAQSNRVGPKSRRARKERVQKPLSFAERRLVALRVGYLGWMFDGFAVQPNKDNTIEARLLNALRTTRLIDDLDLSELNWTRGGRTDAGVSAVGNVVGIRVRSNRESPPFDYAKILNGVLPEGVRILDWAFAIDQDMPAAGRRAGREGLPFDARNDALHRTYKYFFHGNNMDLENMRAAAGFFVGRHDFRNFCKIDVKNQTSNFERVVLSISVERVKESALNLSGGHLSVLTVRGQAFLWHQIRNMAAVLFMVGLGREEPSVVQKLLNIERGGDFFGGKPTFRMASDLGLVLDECAYPPEVVQFCSQTASSFSLLRKIERPSRDMLLQFSLKGAVIGEMLKVCGDLPTEQGVTWKIARALAPADPWLLDFDASSLPLVKRQQEGA